jgi:integrase
MASLRKRGETFHITVSLGNDEQGRQVRKFTTFTPSDGSTDKQGRRAAEEYAREFERRCKGLAAYDENMTLSELCEWFFETIAPNKIRERTAENSRHRLRLYILPELGRKKLRELSPALLDKHFMELQKSGGAKTLYRPRDCASLAALVSGKGSYREADRHGVVSKGTMSLILNGRRPITEATGRRLADYVNTPFKELFEVAVEKTPLSANSVVGVIASLGSVMSSAFKAGIIKENPMARCTLPKIGEIERPVLTPEQARLFLKRLAEVENISIKAFLVTALLTGVRSGELRALKWSELNLEKGLLSVIHSVDKNGKLNPPKTKSSVRIIRLDAALTGILRAYKSEQNEYSRSIGDLWTENDLVFPNTTGGYMTGGTPNQALKRLIRDTDIPPALHVHSLRHSFASIGIASGATAPTVAAALGHSSTQTTLEIYAHAFTEQQAEMVAAVSLAITGD